MKRREWIYVILPLVLTWTVDRLTKLWATNITETVFYGPIGYTLHHNHGAILGLFSDLPTMLRIVSLSTGGAFLLFLYGIIQFLIPSKTLMLRIGLSFLIGGIIGNVSDRIYWGYVVDFIIFGSPSQFSPAFNLADALQWIGYFLVVIAFIKDGKNLWPTENLRKSYWINFKFQLKYCFILMGCGLGLTIILGTFSYTYLNVTIRELRGPNPILSAQFLKPYVATFGIVSLTFSLVLFAIGLILSHRAAGPLYAFERFMNDFLDGKNPKLKLRTGDDFKELEDIADRVSKQVSPKSSQTKSG